MNIEANLNLHLTLDKNISLAQELNISVNETMLAERAEACLLSTEARHDPKDPLPEELLVQAIVLQAVADWRCAVAQLRLTPGNTFALTMKQDAEVFFRSRWFRMLIDLDGADLLKRLQQLEGWTDSSPAQDRSAQRMARFQRSMKYKTQSKTRKQAG